MHLGTVIYLRQLEGLERLWDSSLRLGESFREKHGIARRFCGSSRRVWPDDESPSPRRQALPKTVRGTTISMIV